LNDNLKAYLSTRYDLAVLKTTEKVSVLGSKSGLVIILGVFALLFVLFGSVAAGFLLSDWLGSYAKGFLVVAGSYFVVFIVVVLFRKALILNPIRNRIIRSILEDKY
jgi:hypothetical protein